MDITFDEVISVEFVTCDSLRYDITVEDNHNFFANGMLVHNCQNIPGSTWSDWQARDLHFEASEKLDGSSTTFYMDGIGELNVCSRNLNLVEDDSNSFWKAAHQYGIKDTLVKDELYGYAIQGELIGEGIQKNRYAIKGQDFYVFDIYNVNTGQYLSTDERNVMTFQLGLKHVPLLDSSFSVRGHTIESLLAYAEAKSALNPKAEREGVVFKCVEDPSISFKVISNLFLVKDKE